MLRNIDQALAVLETAAKKPISDRDTVKCDIEKAVAACPPQDAADGRLLLDRCIHGLALIYVRVTGKLPGYSNSDNLTHFERFVAQLGLPSHLPATPTYVRAAIRRLDAKNNPLFLTALAERRA